MNQDVMDFLTKAAKDNEFAEKFSKLTTKEGVEGFVKENGYNFTFDELATTINLLKQQQA